MRCAAAELPSMCRSVICQIRQVLHDRERRAGVRSYDADTSCVQVHPTWSTALAAAVSASDRRAEARRASSRAASWAASCCASALMLAPSALFRALCARPDNPRIGVRSGSLRERVWSVLHAGVFRQDMTPQLRKKHHILTCADAICDHCSLCILHAGYGGARACAATHRRGPVPRPDEQLTLIAPVGLDASLQLLNLRQPRVALLQGRGVSLG